MVHSPCYIAHNISNVSHVIPSLCVEIREASYVFVPCGEMDVFNFSSAATGVVLAGNARFHSEARASVNIIIMTANEASETLYNTTGALKDIQTKLERSNVGDVASNILSSTSDKLDAESAIIEMQASKNRRLIHKGLRVV